MKPPVCEPPSRRIVANKSLGLLGLEGAIQDIGKGEVPGKNNRGPYIDQLCLEAGLPWLVGEAPSWCCILVCAKTACAVGGPDNLPFKPLASAENCFNGMTKVPGAIIVFDDFLPGDILLWKRYRFGVRVGSHIAFARRHWRDKDRLITVDGNKDRKRGGKKYALVDSFLHPQGEWRENFVAGVRLP